MAAKQANKQRALEIAERIEGRIRTIRGHKVVLDAHLAELYGVPTKRLNEQVKRNEERFPEDFVFQLTEEETNSLRSQFATSNRGRGGRRYRPYAFTEHGAIMAANVLNSPHAVQMSVLVVRAFVRMRQALLTRTDMEKRLAEIEKTLIGHDAALRDLYDKIRPLLLPAPAASRPRIGFRGGEP
jgi:phage regulator Rha-like protein